MTFVVTFVVTFGCDFWFKLGIGIGDWDGGGIGDWGLEIGKGIGIGDWDWVLGIGCDF